MKLYWRIKKNGKWTWRPAHDLPSDPDAPFIKVLKLENESRSLEEE